MSSLPLQPESFEQEALNIEFQDLIQRIREAKTDNFFELSKLADLDLAEDLAGSDLSGTDLSGLDLSGSNLSYTDLRGANLIGTSLKSAQLNKANLIGADLRNANLADVKVKDAKFGKNLGISEGLMASLIGAGANFELPVNLSSWQNEFSKSIKMDWQSTKVMLGIEQRDLFPVFASTHPTIIARCKFLDLDKHCPRQLALVVGVRFLSKDERVILLKLLPAKGHKLPSNTRLNFIAGSAVHEERISEKSEGHFLNIRGRIGEHFQIQICVGGAVAVESFVM